MDSISPEKESPKIEFPNNIDTIKKLQDKLKEYRQRLEVQKKGIDQYKSPEQIFQRLADSHYKIAVVEKLLLEGVVDIHELSRELNEKDGQFDSSAFSNACAVIEDYSKTGGKSIVGRTGLK